MEKKNKKKEKEKERERRRNIKVLTYEWLKMCLQNLELKFCFLKFFIFLVVSK